MKKLMILLSGLLTGCAENPYDVVQTPVQESLYQLPASTSPALTAQDTAGLDSFLNTLPSTAVKMAIVEPGTSYEPGKTEALQRYLMQKQFAPQSIRLANAIHPHPSLAVRVRYRIYPAAADCSVWPEEGTWNELNTITGRMGCSTSNNIRTMVANPNDLLIPNADPHAEEETAVRAVGIYKGTMEDTRPEPQEASNESQTTDE